MSVVVQAPDTGRAAVPLQPSIAPPPAGLLRLLARDRTAMLGLVLVSALALTAVIGPAVAPHNPLEVDVYRRLARPSATFPLGTDDLGRDLLSRLLYGARTSIGTAFVATVLIAAIGVTLGTIAGYARGAVDALIGRVIDVLLAFPSFLLALAVTGVLGTGLRNVVLGVVVAWWAGFARVVRAAVLAEQERPYVEAARALGASHARVVWRHLLRNVLGPVVVLVTLDMGGILLGISALSFLGLGVKAPTPEWGAMIAEGRNYTISAPQVMVAPGVAIFLMVLGFNLLGDGLRDVLDPRTRHQNR